MYKLMGIVLPFWLQFSLDVILRLRTFVLRMPDAQKTRTRITLTATANLDLWEMAMNFVKVRWCRRFNGL